MISNLLDKDTKPTELITSLITLGLALSLISNAEYLYGGQHHNIIGIILLFTALSQIAGLTLSMAKVKAVSRVMRWSASVIDGGIWFLLFVFAIPHVKLTDGLLWIFAALLLADLWIVMGIAYRGYRGRDTNPTWT